MPKPCKNDRHDYHLGWGTEGAIYVCWRCHAYYEVDDIEGLQETLESLIALKQELLDCIEMSNSNCDGLQSGVKDKDKQIYWVKRKLEVLSKSVET